MISRWLTTKPGQKFCSDPCAAPAKREAKLKWWRRHGRQQRKEKAKKQKEQVKNDGIQEGPDLLV